MGLLSLLLKYKDIAKILGVAGSGSGILILVLYLHEDVSAKITSVELDAKTYVDYRHQEVRTEIKHLHSGQKEIKEMLKVIDKRIYDLKK